MEKTPSASRRQTIPRSPSLQRSKSVTTNVNQKSTLRSKSIDKPAATKIKINSSTQKGSTEGSTNKDDKESLVKFMHGATSNGLLNRQARSCPSSPRRSPSARTLSSGRSSPSVGQPESRGKDGDAGGRGRGKSADTSPLLKCFKQKKVSNKEQEVLHQFRIMQSRLLQWRYINARTDKTLNSVKKVAEYKLFCVWIMIVRMRNSILEKRLQVQKMKHVIKLYQVVYPQIEFYDEWTKLERKNSEGVSRLARKLSALFSVRVPLVECAEADEKSLLRAMNEAVEVMDGIEEIISKFLTKVEKLGQLLLEIILVMKQGRHCLTEFEKYFPLVN